MNDGHLSYITKLKKNPSQYQHFSPATPNGLLAWHYWKLSKKGAFNCWMPVRHRDQALQKNQNFDIDSGIPSGAPLRSSLLITASRFEEGTGLDTGVQGRSCNASLWTCQPCGRLIS
jgi:hypothetical protein